MNPDALAARIGARLRAGDYEAADAAAGELDDWLGHGGAPPAGMTRDEAFELVEAADRECSDHFHREAAAAAGLFPTCKGCGRSAAAGGYCSHCDDYDDAFDYDRERDDEDDDSVGFPAESCRWCSAWLVEVDASGVCRDCLEKAAAVVPEPPDEPFGDGIL